MNRTIHLAGRTIPVWFLMATIVGAGSLAIAVQGADDQSKFQIEDDTKPKSNSLVFTGLPVQFDSDGAATTTDEVSDGVEITSSQRVRVNFKSDVGEEVTVTLPVTNNSDDPQIVLLECDASEQVIIDAIEGGIVDSVRSNAQNSWLLNLAADTTDDLTLTMATEHAGAYSVMCQMLAVG
jgi:hypothetical protein